MSGMAATSWDSWSTRRLPKAQKKATKPMMRLTMTVVVASARGIHRVRRATAGSMARARNQLRTR